MSPLAAPILKPTSIPTREQIEQIILERAEEIRNTIEGRPRFASEMSCLAIPGDKDGHSSIEIASRWESYIRAIEEYAAKNNNSAVVPPLPTLLGAMDAKLAKLPPDPAKRGSDLDWRRCVALGHILQDNSLRSTKGERRAHLEPVAEDFYNRIKIFYPELTPGDLELFIH